MKATAMMAIRKPIAAWPKRNLTRCGMADAFGEDVGPGPIPIS
jgi:hypothetical protein